MLKRKREVTSAEQLQAYIEKHEGSVEGLLETEEFPVGAESDESYGVTEQGVFSINNQGKKRQIVFRGFEDHEWASPVPISEESVLLGAIRVISRHKLK